MRSQRLGDGAPSQHASAHLAAHPGQARPARALITVQLLLNALALGMAYALVALGFVLALNAAGAVNFAHGDLVVLGGAVAVFVGLATGLPAVLLLPLVALAIGVVGIIAARIAILPLATRPPEATFVATIALAAIIEQSLTIAMAGAPRTVPPIAGSGSFEIAGLVLGRQPLAIVVLGAALVAAVWFLLERTQTGRRMRAVAADRHMARAVGIPVGRYVTLSLALAGALAGVAGFLLGHQFLVAPTQGAGH
ncbi:MAG TPA: branched-chain amino acid ABC transporter permease, partial [Reyranella sp.]